MPAAWIFRGEGFEMKQEVPEDSDSKVWSIFKNAAVCQ